MHPSAVDCFSDTSCPCKSSLASASDEGLRERLLVEESAEYGELLITLEKDVLVLGGVEVHGLMFVLVNGVSSSFICSIKEHGSAPCSGGRSSSSTRPSVGQGSCSIWLGIYMLLPGESNAGRFVVRSKSPCGGNGSFSRGVSHNKDGFVHST